MKKIIVSTILMTFLFGFSYAQNGSIKGIVADNTDKSPLPGATVSLLLQADSSLVKSTTSNAQGDFLFSNLPVDSFIVTISTVGYQQFVSFITLNNTDRTYDTIGMQKQGTDLSVVTIIAKAAPVTQRGDTSQYSASQYKVNPDATTEDLIKKMPGITVDKDGTITAQGEQVRKVTVDGKDFFGDDATAALKNLPSEIVDKIQVFDRLSDQAQLTGFDDGNSQKSINIVTKSGLKNGQFGRAYAGYGTDDRYSAGGNVSFFKGNRRLSFVGNFNNINQQNFASQDLLGLTSSGNNRGGGGQRGGGGRPGGGGSDNFNVGQSSGISRTNALGINFGNQWGKKATFSGSYFFNNSTNVNRSDVSTQFVDLTRFSLDNANTVTTNNNHRINLRLEYKFDSSNSLTIIPSLNFQNNNSVSDFSSQTFRGTMDSINNSFVRSNSDRKGYNFRNNILFRHSFAKRGRTISLGLNTTFSENNSESINDGRYRYFDQDGAFVYDSLQNQFRDNVTNGRTVGGRIAYTEPVGKKSQLQFDYSPSIQKNTADQQTFSFDGQKYSTLETRLSNKFDNTITTNNGGVGYQYSPGRDEQFSVGVNFQKARLESERSFPTVSSVNQTFSNILPNLMYRKKLSASSNVRVFYRSSTNFPSVNQLQDVVDVANPLRITIGNPDLKQSNTHLVSGRYTYTNSKTSRSFFANLFLQTASDYITNAIYIAGKDSVIQQNNEIANGAQLTRPVNLDGYKSLRTFFTYSMPIKVIKTNLNLNAGFSYSKLPGLLNNVKTNTDNIVYNTGVVLSSNISEFIDYNVSYNANFNEAKTNSTVASNNNNKFVNQAIGAQFNLLSKKGWFVQNDISHQRYSGLTAGFNQNYTLWNAGLGRKFLKNNAGELKLTVFDLLEQNQSIIRTVTNNYIEDAQSEVLQRYFMLTFTYNLKNFGVAARPNNGNQRGERGMGNPAGF